MATASPLAGDPSGLPCQACSADGSIAPARLSGTPDARFHDDRKALSTCLPAAARSPSSDISLPATRSDAGGLDCDRNGITAMAVAPSCRALLSARPAIQAARDASQPRFPEQAEDHQQLAAGQPVPSHVRYLGTPDHRSSKGCRPKLSCGEQILSQAPDPHESRVLRNRMATVLSFFIRESRFQDTTPG